MSGIFLTALLKMLLPIGLFTLAIFSMIMFMGFIVFYYFGDSKKEDKITSILLSFCVSMASLPFVVYAVALWKMEI